MLAPGLRLVHAGDGPRAGRLGGLPELPADTPWPVREGNGPLPHIAALGCAALTAAGGAGLPLPVSGTLRAAGARHRLGCRGGTLRYPPPVGQLAA
ncbi:DUF1963 domain-containing protein [Streptomyces sp. NPDC002120]|uniref:DUF1963 domain-containing protein n=1 Tax=Streptomyces sp. NPDC002120 TaxID=3364631 RepID=UPI0036A2A9F1